MFFNTVDLIVRSGPYHCNPLKIELSSQIYIYKSRHLPCEIEKNKTTLCMCTKVLPNFQTLELVTVAFPEIYFNLNGYGYIN